MGWLNIIILIFRYGPMIIKLIRELMDALKSSPEPKMRSLASDVEKVAVDFKKRRDKKALQQDLRNLIEKVKKNQL